MLATLEAKALGALAVIAVLGMLFGAYKVHEHRIVAEAKAAEVEQLKMSSAKLIQKADEQIAANNSTHAAVVAAIKETADAQHQIDTARNASDADRLREYDAYRRLHPAVGSPASGQGDPGAGSSSVVGDGDRLTSLEQVALDLAVAGRSSLSALKSCTVERDSLTGK